MSRFFLLGRTLGAWLPLGLVAAGCGDPVLPADYTGPPESAISGDVLPGTGGASLDANRPRLSLEWLAGIAPLENGAPTLVSQPLSFQRSARLQNDWDIGLEAPAELVKFEGHTGSPVRLGVGKVVYFDDRIPDDKLGWGCRDSVCDQIKAVSAQFVLYVDRAPTCPTGSSTPSRLRFSPGYHYIAFDGKIFRELGSHEALSFTLDERALPDSNPTADLRAFSTALLRAWSLSSLGDCSGL